MPDTTEKKKSSSKSHESENGSQPVERIQPLPPTPAPSSPTTLGPTESGTQGQMNSTHEGQKYPVKGQKGAVKLKPPLPRGGHYGSKVTRGGMKFGERTSLVDETHSLDDEEGPSFNASKFERMTAVHFHKYNDLSLARGVGYKPDQAVSKYGPGVTHEAETLYGPCRLLTDFQYSTWTETVVPLRNHNVVQGFNEVILFLMKLAADPDGPVNHEEAFLAASFLANIRNDLGEHPPNVLALLEYIDYKSRNDGTERPYRLTEVIPP